MSLSDCGHCYDTPCECGHKYRNASIGWLTMMRDMFQKLIDEFPKRNCPKCNKHGDWHTCGASNESPTGL